MMQHLLNRLALILFITLGMLTWPTYAIEQAAIEQVPEGDAPLQNTIRTLNSLIKLQSELKSDIKRLGGELKAAESASEEKQIQ